MKVPDEVIFNLNLTELRRICLVLNTKKTCQEEISLREDPE